MNSRWYKTFFFTVITLIRRISNHEAKHTDAYTHYSYTELNKCNKYRWTGAQQTKLLFYILFYILVEFKRANVANESEMECHFIAEVSSNDPHSKVVCYHLPQHTLYRTIRVRSFKMKIEWQPYQRFILLFQTRLAVESDEWDSILYQNMRVHKFHPLQYIAKQRIFLSSVRYYFEWLYLVHFVPFPLPFNISHTSPECELAQLLAKRNKYRHDKVLKTHSLSSKHIPPWKTHFNMQMKTSPSTIWR